MLLEELYIIFSAFTGFFHSNFPARRRNRSSWGKQAGHRQDNFNATGGQMDYYKDMEKPYTCGWLIVRWVLRKLHGPNILDLLPALYLISEVCAPCIAYGCLIMTRRIPSNYIIQRPSGATGHRTCCSQILFSFILLLISRHKVIYLARRY
jgi:hypothetical protein